MRATPPDVTMIRGRGPWNTTNCDGAKNPAVGPSTCNRPSRIATPSTVSSCPSLKFSVLSPKLSPTIREPSGRSPWTVTPAGITTLNVSAFGSLGSPLTGTRPMSQLFGSLYRPLPALPVQVAVVWARAGVTARASAIRQVPVTVRRPDRRPIHGVKRSDMHPLLCGAAAQARGAGFRTVGVGSRACACVRRDKDRDGPGPPPSGRSTDLRRCRQSRHRNPQQNTHDGQ